MGAEPGSHGFSAKVTDNGTVRNQQGAPGNVTDRLASETEPTTNDADTERGIIRVYVYELPTRFNWEIIHKFGAGSGCPSSLLQGPGVFAADKYGQAKDDDWGWPPENQAGNLTVLLPLGLEDLLVRSCEEDKLTYGTANNCC